MNINLIAYISVIIQLIGVSFYIRGMIKGTTKPNRVSWAVWALAPLIGVWLQWKAGAGLSLLPVFMSGFNPLLVLIASFIIKQGYWKITKFDVVCGMTAVFALVLWLITKSLGLSILFAILSDFLASLPTLKKVWFYPETETSTAYTGGLIANILGLFMITEWSFSIYSFGIYMVAINLVIVVLIYRKRIFKSI